MKFEFRLRFSTFQPIEAPNGAATSSASETQTSKSLSATQEGILSRNAPGTGQAAS
jgi:hypothetical protein